MTANEVTVRYLERCVVDAELREAGIRAPYEEGFAAGVGSGLMSRPLFLPDPLIRAAGDDVVRMFGLITSLPDRLFGGDGARYAAALGVNEVSTRVALRGGLRPPPPYGRADLIYDGTGFRFLEANIGSELGGCHIGEISRGLLAVDAFAAFVDEYRLINVEPGERIAAMLRRVAAPVTGGGRDPVIAVVEWTGTFATVPEPYRLFTVELARHGITVHLAEVGQLESKDGKLHFQGEPIDIALRYFMLHEACNDPDGEALLDPLFQAHADGGTILFTHPQTNLYSYKDNLALLSDTRYRSAYSADEIALIDRMLPWTRLVDDGRTDVDGESVDLREYCLAHRGELIAKPHAGFSSYGTVAGWETTDEEWAEIIAKSPPNGYIVQRRVTGTAEPVIDPASGRTVDWLPIHGVFVIDEGYAGDYIRASPVDRSAVISGTAGALITSMFSYPTGRTR